MNWLLCFYNDILYASIVYCDLDIEKEILLCEKDDSSPVYLAENQCYELFGDLKQDCLNMITSAGEGVRKNNVYDDISKDKVLYYNNNLVFSTKCSIVEKISVPSEYSTNDKSCLKDIPVKFWLKNTDIANSNIAYLTEEGILRKDVGNSVPCSEAKASFYFKGHNINVNGKC